MFKNYNTLKNFMLKNFNINKNTVTLLDGGKQEDTKDNKIQPKAALLREGFP